MAEVSVAIADDNRQTLNLLGEILEKEDGDPCGGERRTTVRMRIT